MARISQQSKEETKNAIVQTALELFTSQGFEKTNTKTIAKSCGIAEGTVFNYFANKDEILMAVFEQMALTEDGSAEATSSEAVDLLLDILMNPLKKMHALSKPFLLDLIIAAMRLSKAGSGLLQKLIAFDMRYVLKVESQMAILLDFEGHSMTPKQLSEILYALIAAAYMNYLFNPEISFEAFETDVRQKTIALFKPYQTMSQN